MYLQGTLEAIGIKGAFMAFSYRRRKIKDSGTAGRGKQTRFTRLTMYTAESCLHTKQRKKNQRIYPIPSFYVRAISTSRFVLCLSRRKAYEKGFVVKKKRERKKKEKTQNAFKQSRS